MVTTTEDNPWVETAVYDDAAEGTEADIVVDLDAVGQTVQGFGTCFSELSHRALSKLSPEDYDTIMTELFAPGEGVNFTICRMPIGSSDFALKYYSFNDTPGDLAMENFSIDNDKETLIPLIKDALAKNPGLKVWGSPWSPPYWMKVNQNYASRPMNGFMRRPPQGGPQRPVPPGLPATTAAEPSFLASLALGSASDRKRLELDNLVKDNGLDMEHMMREGQDSFIQDERYFEAYALYFKKYVQAYRDQGIDIFMVMPQNEFNSAQNFPSCTWTAQGITNFLHHLVPAMEEEGVEVYFGTMERANRALVDTVLTDPLIGKDIKGVAFQWAGKDALPLIHESYPELTMVMSEQQCFNGANSWSDFMSAWDLLKFNMDNGVGIYDYWNLALFDGEVSTWGWQQNSLISVDYETGEFKYNYEFYEMKHISRYVQPGAVYLGTSGSMEEAMAFRNPDGSIVILTAEKKGEPRKLAITAGKKTVNVNIPANSVSTIVF
jgi:glucosylceramidase